MGSAMSSHAKGKKEFRKPAVRGHKTVSQPAIAIDESNTINNNYSVSPATVVEETREEIVEVLTDETESEDDYSDSDEESDEEEDEDFEERLAILADCQKLKFFAEAYLHPEAPVEMDFPGSRCYFERMSAPEVESEDEEERERIFQDLESLKKQAEHFDHPEKPVVCTDDFAEARCFFDRPSAPSQDDEAASILEDAMKLKALATAYMHPELPVTRMDPTASARCFFDRPSAPEDEQDGADVLADALALKKLARAYLHPEDPVVCEDPTATARCFFDRPSVVETEVDNDMLQEVASLKQLARFYMHPEDPVTSMDGTACARNYFDRPSAPHEDDGEEEEREAILADVAALKKQAVFYLHPELPVSCDDPTATARCFFDRPSAPHEDDEESEARAQVLADVAALKKQAVMYLHPELPVSCDDPTATARCFFDRPSAEEGSDEEEEEREAILADALKLKSLAVDFFHPERPVVCTDSTATARCYFDRRSAPLSTSASEEAARDVVLADMAALKKYAKQYTHPELPVVPEDPCATARCYFAEAPECTAEEDVARQAALADLAAMKTWVSYYAHPERPVVCDDPSASARCYFSRPAVYTEDVDETETFGDATAVKARQSTRYSDIFEMEDDHHVLTDLRKEVGVAFQRRHSFGEIEESGIISKEEEGHLSRSPSSVMLFELAGVSNDEFK